MEAYRIVNRGDSRSLAEYLTDNGQIFLPMVELIEGSRMAIDELMDVLGQASIEAVLELSARGVAGEKQQGRKKEAVRWHGRQAGSVRLSDRKLVSDSDVSRPRLIRDARFLEADRREIALWRGRHNRLGFVYPVAFVRVLGRWKNVILYREIKIDPVSGFLRRRRHR